MSSGTLTGPHGRAATGPDGAGPDVVFSFGRMTWQAASRRGFHHSQDRLARTLIDSPRVGRLLIANQERHMLARLARRLDGSDRVPFPASERIHLVEPVSLRRAPPVALPAAIRACREYDRSLARAARRHGLMRPHLVTGDPLLAGFAPLSWAASITWYAVDDWAEHPSYREWADVFRESYRRVAERGCRVAAVSRPLLERLAPTGPAIVVPNGIDSAEWRDPGPPPAWMASLPRPIYLYVGALDSRIDVAQIRALAAAQTGTVLFVGPLADAEHLAPLRALPNVEIRPEVRRAALPGLVRAADVGLLPHLVSSLTLAMSPLKLFEYLAAGLPVLASDLEPVRQLAEPRVTLVPADGDIGRSASVALAAGRAPETNRRRFIEDNSWHSRHDRLLDLAFG